MNVGIEDLLADGREDLIDARQLAVGGEDARQMALYHARQAAEKFINAMAAYKNIQAGPVSDLKILWKSLDVNDEELDKVVDELLDSTLPETAELLLKKVNTVLDLMKIAHKMIKIVPKDLPEVILPNKSARKKNAPAPRRPVRQKRFFVCNRCGVNIPFTHHTSRGRVICPHCGGLMRLVS